MYRAAQQKDLMDRLHQNNIMHKVEQDEMRAKREEFERVRLETLAEQRRYDKEVAELRKAEMHGKIKICLLYTSPSPRDATLTRMPSSA